MLSQNTASSESDSAPENVYSPSDFAGYWFNDSSSTPYCMQLKVFPSASSYVVEIAVYSDMYEWTATAYEASSLKFTYDNGFQKSHDEMFNLPDLCGSISFDAGSHTVVWNDDSVQSITFSKSISKSDFNSFLERIQTHSTSSAVNYSEAISGYAEIAGHYVCSTNNNEAYINIYSSPDGNAVGNFEVYSSSGEQIFSGKLYPTGTDNYDARSNSGSQCHLYVYSDFDGSKDGFYLGAIPASDSLVFEGNYDITERYAS